MSEGVETLHPSVLMPQATLTPDERRQIGRQRAGQRVKEAMALKAQTENADGALALAKEQAKAAVPLIIAYWMKAALGQLKGWPAAARLKAGENVCAFSGVSLEVAPGAGSGVPLGELPLADLERTLFAMLETVRDMKAIDSTGEVVPNLGATQAPAPSEAPAQVSAAAASADDDPPAGGRNAPFAGPVTPLQNL